MLALVMRLRSRVKPARRKLGDHAGGGGTWAAADDYDCLGKGDEQEAEGVVGLTCWKAAEQGASLTMRSYGAVGPQSISENWTRMHGFVFIMKSPLVVSFWPTPSHHCSPSPCTCVPGVPSFYCMG